MPEYLNWKKLLSSERLKSESDANSDENYETRSPFERDCSRIIFSDSFRRLGRKTQVHPLSKNDHIHTRLTHSQEVAAFGHSLASCVWDYMAYLSDKKDKSSDDGKKIGNSIDHIKKNTIALDMIKDGFEVISNTSTRSKFASIVQAASYAHDIGNPPFGHAGEDAIRDWMKGNDNIIIKIDSEDEKNDIRYFEGNAQGIRLVTNTEGFHEKTGLNLTAATLGTMMKYPWTSTESKTKSKKRKYNYLQSELNTIKTINCILGLSNVNGKKYVRHPLSYLMEAADDICYAMIDIEDAMELGIIGINDIEGIMKEIFNKVDEIEKTKDSCQLLTCSLNSINSTIEILKTKKNQPSTRRIMAKYRSRIMNLLTNQVASGFLENYKEIMEGSLSDELIIKSSKKIPYIIINRFKEIAKNKIFNDSRIIEFEVGCSSTIGVLLDSFIKAADDKISNGGNMSIRSKKILKLMSSHTKISDEDDHYIAYLKALDFVSGMTDNYASYLSKQLHGIFST